ncbi:MAG: hypothetical protein ACJA08_001352 [Cyclobacteriaceae bacterium]|jgi:hypothetical protein
MKTLVLIISLLAIVGCRSENKESDIACTDFDKLDIEMMQLIDKIESKFTGNKSFLEAFKMEQVYWIQYRDRRLRSMYPKNWDTHYRKNFGKDVFNPCKCQELLRLANNRMDDLDLYMEGGPQNQKNCPSIMNE